MLLEEQMDSACEVPLTDLPRGRLVRCYSRFTEETKLERVVQCSQGASQLVALSPTFPLPSFRFTKEPALMTN